MYGEGIPNYIIDKARAYCARWDDQIKKATFLRQFMGIQLVADDMAGATRATGADPAGPGVAWLRICIGRLKRA